MKNNNQLNITIEVKIATLVEKEAYFKEIGINTKRNSFKMPKMYTITYKLGDMVSGKTACVTRLPLDIASMINEYEVIQTSGLYKASLKEAYDQYEEDFCTKCAKRLTHLVQDRDCNLRSKAKGCKVWMYNRHSATPVVAKRVAEYTVNCSAHQTI